MSTFQLSEAFVSYFSNLLKILFLPKIAYVGLFDNRRHSLQKAIGFAFMSIMISFSIIVLSDNILNLNIGLKWDSMAKYIAIIPILFILVIPLSGLILLIVKLFHGEGTINDSAALIFYSYSLSPYAAFILMLFLYVEKLKGYPLSLKPPADPTLAYIELGVEVVVLIYGAYIFARGIEVGHKLKFSSACVVTLLLSLTMIACGYFSTFIEIKRS